MMKKQLTAYLFLVATFTFCSSVLAAPPRSDKATSHIPEKAVAATADVETGKPADPNAHGKETSEAAKAKHAPELPNEPEGPLSPPEA